MTRPRQVLAALLLAAVMTTTVTAGAAPVTPTAQPGLPSRGDAAQPDADAFDALATRLERGALTAATPDQARDQLARLRRLLPPGDPRRDLRYRYLACGAAPGDAKATITLATRGIADARVLEDTHAQVRFLYCRADARASVAPPDQTLGDWEAGLAMARANRDWRLVADGLVGRGYMRSLDGEHARALNDFLTAQQLYRTTGHDALARENALNLGIAYRRMGDLEEARTHVQQALDEATRGDDWGTRFNALLQLGYLYEDLGQLSRAQESYEQALNLAPREQARAQAGVARLALAGVLIARDQHATALEALDQAERELAGTTDTARSGLLRMRRGHALVGLGRNDEALREYEAAERLMRQQDNERYLAMLLPARAEALEASGQPDRALAEYRRFVQLEGKLLDDSARQRATAMRHRFDARRRELDTQRLLADTALQRQELDALVQARRWQWLALTLGAVLVLVLAARLLRQQWRTRRLRSLATTDPLTGVANRRAIDHAGNAMFATARTGDTALSVLMLDIDRFKQINDVHGHLAGDEVLRRVAAACQGALRGSDRLGRFGGEEFVAVLPGTEAAPAAQVAERLRLAVEAIDLDDVAAGLRVTVSVGLVTLRADDAGFDALVERADRALYRAKAGGRNRVERDNLPG